MDCEAEGLLEGLTPSVVLGAHFMGQRDNAVLPVAAMASCWHTNAQQNVKAATTY
jgi:hypothetical protein